MDHLRQPPIERRGAAMACSLAHGEESGRLPGSVSGEQFIIRNCDDSAIFVFDNTNCVTVDDCKNCKIFLGPVKVKI